MSYRRLCKKSLLFRSLTELTVPEFDQISSRDRIRNMRNMKEDVFLKGRGKEMLMPVDRLN